MFAWCLLFFVLFVCLIVLFVCLIFFVFVYLIVLLVVFGIYCIQTNSHFFDLIIYLVEVVYRSFVVLM